jgi:transitional endoplasmic reticulum ATPase
MATGAIGMTHNVMQNEGVRSGDRVTVCTALDVAFGKAVLVLPYGDAIAEARRWCGGEG